MAADGELSESERATREELSALISARIGAKIWRAEIDAVFRETSPLPRRRIVLDVWKDVFAACLSDLTLSPDELQYLGELRSVLDIGEDDVIGVERRLVHPVLKRTYLELMADGVLSEEEMAHLARIGAALDLSPSMQRHLLEGV